MKNKNVCDFGDILSYACTIGYDWNQAHEILVDANYCAMYGPQDVYKGELEDDGSDAYKIMSGYFEHENVTEFQIKG